MAPSKDIDQIINKIVVGESNIDPRKDIDQLIKKKIVYWKKKIIDLTARNRLVSFKPDTRKLLKIEAPSFQEILGQLDKDHKIVFFRNKKEPKEFYWVFAEEDEVADERLYKIYLKTRENFQEQGVNTCFIILGLVQYIDKQTKEKLIDTPLFLQQVQIDKMQTCPKDYHRYEILPIMDELKLNPALQEKLFVDFDVKLKEYTEQPVMDYIAYLKKAVDGVNLKVKIKLDCYLDIVSYQKFVMYKDFEKHEQLIHKSKIIRRYVGDSESLKEQNYLFESEEHDDVSDIDVLPADSSQKRAIELAKKGVSFALQGPPGTGKSQTIVNIIASLIAQKKKVLFVSQKMAALNVVQKRLDGVGLGRYCLNLHKFGGDKKDIVEQLMNTLMFNPVIKDSAKRYSFSNYLTSQQTLDSYYHVISQKHKPRMLSIYGARGEIANLKDVEFLDKEIKSCLSLNEEGFQLILNKISKMEKILNEIGVPFNNSYYQFDTSKKDNVNRSRFSLVLDDALHGFEKVKSLCKEINKETSFEPSSTEDLLSISNIEDLFSHKEFEGLPSFLVSPDFDKISKVVSELKEKLEETHKIRKKILSYTDKKFLSLDTKQFEKIFGQTSLFGRIFNSTYKETVRELDKYSEHKLAHKLWVTIFDQKNKLEKLKDYLQNFNKENKKICLLLQKPLDLSNILKVYDYCCHIKELREKAKKLSNNPDALISYAYNSKAKVGTTLNSLTQSISKINPFFEGNVIQMSGKLEKIAITLKKFHQELRQFEEVIEFKTTYLSLENDCKKFLQSYVDHGTKTPLIKVFMKSYYMQLLQDLINKQDFSTPRDAPDLLRSESNEVMNVARYKIIEEIEKHKPKHYYQSSGISDLAILKREAEKKRRLKAFRDLLDEIPQLIFALKPCFMMSPLTVSQYIDPQKIKFDAVIFDEASQIMPEDAIPCLIRTDQVIVMGDTQQLPPTDFFLRKDDEFFVEEEDLIDLPSFLSEANATFNCVSINFHYRSRSESLIDFSNRNFYYGRLITFPNSRLLDQWNIGFVYVKEAIYGRGKSRNNPKEAKEVVNVLKKIKNEYPDKSIGIIAFSISQEGAILEELERAGIQSNISVNEEDEDFFVKNLETVQGDERDIIIISVGYGRDEEGKLHYNFGPLMKENGYKRLNVAITRARHKTIIVSSILPTEFKDDIKSDGVRLLRDYLAYAQRGIKKESISADSNSFDSHISEEIYNTLKSEGFSVEAKVGSSGYKIDVAIKNPKKEEYVLAIDCDGSYTQASKYARDKDIIRPMVLEELGWSNYRVWSEDWLNNSKKEVDRIKKAMERSVDKGEPKTKEDKFKVQEVKSKDEGMKSEYHRYKVADLPHRRVDLKINADGDIDSYDVSEDDITEAMAEVLKVESPIEKELLFRRVLDSFGIRRIGRRIEGLFERLLEDIKESNELHVRGKTLSLEPIEAYCKPRVSSEEQRPFTLIPKEEVAGAIIDLVTHNVRIAQEAIVSDVAKGIYKNNRIGTQIESKVKDAVDYLINKKLIKLKGGMLTLVKE